MQMLLWLQEVVADDFVVVDVVLLCPLMVVLLTIVASLSTKLPFSALESVSQFPLQILHLDV